MVIELAVITQPAVSPTSVYLYIAVLGLEILNTGQRCQALKSLLADAEAPRWASLSFSFLQLPNQL